MFLQQAFYIYYIHLRVSRYQLPFKGNRMGQFSFDTSSSRFHSELSTVALPLHGSWIMAEEVKVLELFKDTNNNLKYKQHP